MLFKCDDKIAMTPFPFVWIVNPIQVHLKFMIDNPKQNSLFILDWQYNPNQITIETALKIMLNDFFFDFNIPKGKLSYPPTTFVIKH